MNSLGDFVVSSSRNAISNKVKVTFPHMGSYHICFKALFEAMDCKVVTPPPITKKTVELGSKYSPEFVCFPFKVTLGCLIEGLEQGADVAIQSATRGSCRYGYYKQVQEKILQDMGYKFRFVKLNSISALKSVNKNATNLQILRGLRLGWAKMKAIDRIEIKSRRISAYEASVGKSRRLYQEFLISCEEACTVTQVREVEKRFSQKFNRIEKIPDFEPLKIGIVGESYVVIEPYSNLDIERQLAQMQVEVIRPLSLSQLSKELLPWTKPAFLRAARPYLRYEAGAHANVSVSEAIAFARRGIDGVIHIKPHACLPEVTAMSALYRISKDYDIPMIFFSFDEHSSPTGIKTRLEAFIELLKRRKSCRNKEFSCSFNNMAT